MTRILFAVLLATLCSSVVIAADAPPPTAAASGSITGKIVEVLEVESFSYLRLQTIDGDIWAAVPRAPIKVGSEITLENVTLMKDFQSKSLNRKFDRIAFGSLSGSGAARSANDVASFHGNAAKADDPGDVKVAKAAGPNAHTVAEIVIGRAKLKDQPVVLRGKVVKVTEAVLGKNWVHLRDGSGSAADKTNDIVATTKDGAKVGDVVVARGVVHTDRDFGAGYSYAVLIEEATLQK